MLVNQCKDGIHNFGVSQWKTQGSHKFAVLFYCKSCLETIHVNDVEKLTSSRGKAESAPKAAKPKPPAA